MSAVINGTTTTSDVESGRASHLPTLATILQVSDPGSSDVAVAIRLQRTAGPDPRDRVTLGVAGLTRDEALDHIRAIQRALGINPDSLAEALRQVEDASNPDEEGLSPFDIQEAWDGLYEAAAASIGAETAAERAAQS